MKINLKIFKMNFIIRFKIQKNDKTDKKYYKKIRKPIINIKDIIRKQIKKRIGFKKYFKTPINKKKIIVKTVKPTKNK